MDNYKYKNRSSYNYNKHHVHDVYKNLGYDYRGNIFKRTTSEELWGNPKLKSMILKIENIIIFLIEHTKMIKKSFSIAHEKNTSNIN